MADRARHWRRSQAGNTEPAMTSEHRPGLPSIPPFRERFPWIGTDLQTLRNVLHPHPRDLPHGERLLLSVSGGDRLAARLDLPPNHAEERPLVVLVHGLTGSEASINVIATARRLVSEGWAVLRLNLRGAGPSSATSVGRYHAGRTEDLANALRALPPRLQRRGVVLLGHSLGGNVVLKFLGEGAWSLPILGGVVVSTPLDLAATCARMMAPRNVVYHRYMLAAMKREALAPGADLTTAQINAVSNVRSVFEFDDLFIAPLFGFRGAEDYYRRNSSGAFIQDIKLPTLIIHALDDPWIPPSCYRTIDWDRQPMVETALSSHGGHMGFHGVGDAVPWHDRITVAWLRKRFGGAMR